MMIRGRRKDDKNMNGKSRNREELTIKTIVLMTTNNVMSPEKKNIKGLFSRSYSAVQIPHNFVDWMTDADKVRVKQ